MLTIILSIAYRSPKFAPKCCIHRLPSFWSIIPGGNPERIINDCKNIRDIISDDFINTDYQITAGDQGIITNMVGPEGMLNIDSLLGKVSIFCFSDNNLTPTLYTADGLMESSIMDYEEREFQYFRGYDCDSLFYQGAANNEDLYFNCVSNGFSNYVETGQLVWTKFVKNTQTGQENTLLEYNNLYRSGILPMVESDFYQLELDTERGGRSFQYLIETKSNTGLQHDTTYVQTSRRDFWIDIPENLCEVYDIAHPGASEINDICYGYETSNLSTPFFKCCVF